MHLLPFLLRAQAVLRRHISAFLAGKSHPTLLRGWPGSTGYQIFVISSQSPPPPSTLTCHYLLLFVTIRHYSRLFATIRTIRTIRDYSLFGIRDCSLFAIRVFQTPQNARLLIHNQSIFCSSRRPQVPCQAENGSLFWKVTTFWKW